MIRALWTIFPKSQCVKKTGNGSLWTIDDFGCLDNSRPRGYYPVSQCMSQTPFRNASTTQRMAVLLWKFWNGENGIISVESISDCKCLKNP